MVDGQIQLDEINTPQPSDLFLRGDQQKLVDAINAKLLQAEPVTELNSEFIGLAVKVKTLQEVKLAYIAAMQTFPTADHVMLGYGFRDEEAGFIRMGQADDREYGGGNAIRKSMAKTKARNCAVFVVRRYGGIHLGTQRFRSIDAAAKAALAALN